MDRDLAAALADDLDAFIRLHDREADAELLAALQAAGFPDSLALPPAGAAGAQAYAALRQALAALGHPVGGAALDRLAADYAGIYLTNRCGASPYESVWVDDDHLTCQQPMFELRQRYAAAGLRVADQRRRYDDHLVCQLQYLRARLLAVDADWADLTVFMDEHLGYWLGQFAERVTQFGDTDFYAGVAQVTYVWVERCREVLDEIHGLPRPPRDVVTARVRRKMALDKAEVAPIKFMPGAQGPSW